MRTHVPAHSPYSPEAHPRNHAHTRAHARGYTRSILVTAQNSPSHHTHTTPYPHHSHTRRSYVLSRLNDKLFHGLVQIFTKEDAQLCARCATLRAGGVSLQHLGVYSFFRYSQLHTPTHSNTQQHTQYTCVPPEFYSDFFLHTGIHAQQQQQQHAVTSLLNSMEIFPPHISTHTHTTTTAAAAAQRSDNTTRSDNTHAHTHTHIHTHTHTQTSLLNSMEIFLHPQNSSSLSHSKSLQFLNSKVCVRVSVCVCVCVCVCVVCVCASVSRCVWVCPVCLSNSKIPRYARVYVCLCLCLCLHGVRVLLKVGVRQHYSVLVAQCSLYVTQGHAQGRVRVRDEGECKVGTLIQTRNNHSHTQQTQTQTRSDTHTHTETQRRLRDT